MTEQTCGTCRHNEYHVNDEEFVCGNRDSECYGWPTFYEDSCEEWEEK